MRLKEESVFVSKVTVDEIMVKLEEKFKDDPTRLSHILGVYDKAVALASNYGFCVERAKYAALLHDYTKNYSTAEHLKILSDLGYQPTDFSEKLLHSHTSTILAYQEFGVCDPEVLEAIKYHTTAHENLSSTMKVLLLADLTEENTRDLAISDEIRKLEFIDLKGAIIRRISFMVERAQEKNYQVSEDTLRALEKAKGEVNGYFKIDR